MLRSQNHVRNISKMKIRWEEYEDRRQRESKTQGQAYLGCCAKNIFLGPHIKLK